MSMEFSKLPSDYGTVLGDPAASGAAGGEEV
jgi:hypothetical protein